MLEIFESDLLEQPEFEIQLDLPDVVYSSHNTFFVLLLGQTKVLLNKRNFRNNYSFEKGKFYFFKSKLKVGPYLWLIKISNKKINVPNKESEGKIRQT